MDALDDSDDPINSDAGDSEGTEDYDAPAASLPTTPLAAAAAPPVAAPAPSPNTAANAVPRAKLCALDPAVVNRQDWHFHVRELEPDHDKYSTKTHICFGKLPSGGRCGAYLKLQFTSGKKGKRCFKAAKVMTWCVIVLTLA